MTLIQASQELETRKNEVHPKSIKLTNLDRRSACRYWDEVRRNFIIKRVLVSGGLQYWCAVTTWNLRQRPIRLVSSLTSWWKIKCQGRTRSWPLFLIMMDWSWAPRSYLALVSTADLHLAVAKRVLRRVTRFVMNEGVQQHLERGREDSMPALRPWLPEFYLALAQLTASRIQFEEAISRAKAGASSQSLAKMRAHPGESPSPTQQVCQKHRAVSGTHSTLASSQFAGHPGNPPCATRDHRRDPQQQTLMPQVSSGHWSLVFARHTVHHSSLLLVVPARRIHGRSSAVLASRNRSTVPDQQL